MTLCGLTLTLNSAIGFRHNGLSFTFVGLKAVRFQLAVVDSSATGAEVENTNFLPLRFYPEA